MRSPVPLLAVAALLSGGAATATAAPEDDGRVVFQGSCAGCHLGSGTLAGGSGPLLAGRGLDPATIRTAVAEGRGLMPAGLATGTDLDVVVAYVADLQRLACVPMAATPAGAGGDPARVRLTRRQVLLNQRVAQAAVRRAAALEAWLRAGVEGRDVCGGALTADRFGPDVQLEGGGPGGRARPAAPRPVAVPPRAPRAGAGAVALSARQLLVSQRIAQAAVRRANALLLRLDAGLTGGDVRDGTVDAGALAPGLRVVRAVPEGAAPAPSSAAPVPRAGGGRVELTRRQLLVNQRVAQAALRRLNRVRDLLARGLTDRELRRGAIGAADLDPALRAGG